MRKFKSILIANRGEIAVRIMKTVQSLGYRAIAVYSEADITAPHVRIADDAILIGSAPVSDSYLNINGIIKAAKATDAEAVHPGYGFLAENADFAESCVKEGLIFIGPSPEAINLMGNKALAKRHMIRANVPCIPGYQDEDQSDTAMTVAANTIGFPIMVKAAAGGGGRGMRLVPHVDHLVSALASARSEALNAFGSEELILEKAVLDPRHVEVQIFADSHGNVIHLGERDCSVQRRYQKIVEEAPCPIMTPKLRSHMGAAAAEAARSIDYQGAGTVEFLLESSGDFYFLEMNTRLQVEHPVTELITGLDLVALQIRIAEGDELGICQDDVNLDGHAIEVRLYAEDPTKDFLPVTGAIDLWQPATGDGVRVDAGVETGFEISSFYDPMLAKIIAWGETREIARHRLINALKGTALFGTATNKNFLMEVLTRESFSKGEATTAFINQEFPDSGWEELVPTLEEIAIASTLQYNVESQEALNASLNVSTALKDWSSAGHLTSRYVYAFGSSEFDVTVTPQRDGTYVVKFGEKEIILSIVEIGVHTGRLTVDGRRKTLLYSAPSAGVLDLSIDGRQMHYYNHIAFAASIQDKAGDGSVKAPMHGRLLSLLVEPGDQVEVGSRLAVLEAMKMQHEILADIDGTVLEVLASAGTQVAAEEPLIKIEAA